MVDVTVRGAGAFGLAVAWACVSRGAKVRVVDPGGVGAGASGGLVGALAPHVPENWNAKKAFQFAALDRGEAFWRDVEEVGGLPSSYARTGRLQPIADDHALALAEARAATARELWEGRYVWEIVEAGEWAPLSPTGRLIHDTLTARMFPRKAVAALAAAIRAKGGDVVPEAPDEGAVVWATGAAGLVEMTEARGRLVGAPVKGQSALLDFDARDLPQIFADTVHIVPHADGTTAIGSTTERDFDEPNTCDDQLDEVLDRARAAVPALADAPVIERWAGLRPRARTRAPMLGAWPGRDGHFVANGGFKIGFGIAPEVGRVMAALVLDAQDEIPDGLRVEDNL
ncbi:NAD(P)/FAD-dependent oxidoreductase [Maritimibacter dapengensis]|uniref:FAD-binding oxidoreductase n=1 Tax=Maritimibacter dapengensis TaxID=2836868 RepID=A0ABS6T780_9RHOB|nr:FAD-dependent oxidoreductase [Maritimibacter dapengensis]MBV7380192.1 FAD-binding oxidoreductase [Maritimibacter dapengensis]